MKREEGRGKREEGRGKREERRGKREERREKREKGRGKSEMLMADTGAHRLLYAVSAISLFIY